MTVLLDDQPLAVEHLGPTATIADLLAEAKTRLEGSGSIIVGFRRNRQEILGEQIEPMLADRLRGDECLEVLTDKPQRVVLAALREMRASFAETFAETKVATEALAAGKVSETLQILAGCLEVWGRTHTSIIQGGVLAGVNFGTLEISGRRVADWLGDLAERLRDLKTAVEKRDNVMLGDILRYELDDALRQWEQFLDGFIAHIESSESGSNLCG